MNQFDVSELTESQRQVAEAAPQSRQLVTAGPGTGKTHVLISRLVALMRTYELGPGELLVLSFTRSAVRVVKERVALAGEDLFGIQAFTFDSFATRLLDRLDPGGRWVEQSYDGRISSAIALLDSKDVSLEEVGDFKHVVVDEMQDLVGVRAQLVQSILKSVDGGFTLLGDPAQGIYNFQLEGEERRVGSAALYAWVRSHFSSDISERALDRNFRASTAEAKTALFAGPRLNETEPDYEAIASELNEALMELPSMGSLEAAVSVLRRDETPTAILSRTNGEALVVSERLWQASVGHSLQRSATERAVAKWVGEVFGYSEIRSIGKTKFLRVVDEVDGAPEPDAAWRMLKRLDRRRTDDIDLARVAERIRVGNVPDELTEPQPVSLVVSTIHRAKGMEFERVILIPPRDRELDPVDLAEETRVLYVAMTRPRAQLVPMTAPSVEGNLKYHQETDRWTRRWWGKNDWQLWGFEVKGDDLDRVYPGGSFIVQTQAAEVQKYLQHSVAPGDEVSLHLVESARNVAGKAVYEARHDGNLIGVTSESFAVELRETIKPVSWWKVRWPIAIEGLRIDSIDTVAGTEVTTRRCGLGVSGIWLRPRLVGLGNVVWSTKGEGTGNE